MSTIDKASGHRLRHIREWYGFETQKAFADHLGISSNRWNNLERGYPVSIEIAKLLYCKCSMSMDYTLLERCRGLSGRQMLELGIIQCDRFTGTI